MGLAWMERERVEGGREREREREREAAIFISFTYVLSAFTEIASVVVQLYTVQGVEK